MLLEYDVQYLVYCLFSLQTNYLFCLFKGMDRLVRMWNPYVPR